MARDKDRFDPTGVIAESYRIEEITEAQCRSIFLDWLLGLKPPVSPEEALEEMIARHSQAAPAHPMTNVLRAGLQPGAARGRRGGARARRN